MIIKSDKITYNTFVYDNNNMEEVPSYTYLGTDINHKLNKNYNIDLRINGGWKAYCGLENNYKTTKIWIWDKKKHLFQNLITHVILYGCQVWGFGISKESWIKTKNIQKNFITYNLKIKGNTPYPFSSQKQSFPPFRA
jgi:hypothetical protein